MDKQDIYILISLARTGTAAGLIAIFGGSYVMLIAVTALASIYAVGRIKNHNKKLE